MATAGRDSTRVTTQQAAAANPSKDERTKGERIVEAAGLTKTFSDFWMRATARAVDGIDFHIDRHEIFGLLGPNGSGKSTTIKMILGLLHKTHGRLVVFGRDPSDVAVKRKIGYLPEETYLYRFLNPTETLDYYGKLFGLDRRTRKRRTGELLEMVGLTQVAHRAAGEFSKGMARRLGLAQALVNDPELLILDEPTSGLDPIGTKQVKDLILELGRRGCEVVHQPREAQAHVLEYLLVVMVEEVGHQRHRFLHQVRALERQPAAHVGRRRDGHALHARREEVNVL